MRMCSHENNRFHIIIYHYQPEYLNVTLKSFSGFYFWFRNCWENAGANIIWTYSSYEVDPL